MFVLLVASDWLGSGYLIQFKATIFTSLKKPGIAHLEKLTKGIYEWDILSGTRFLQFWTSPTPTESYFFPFLISDMSSDMPASYNMLPASANYNALPFAVIGAVAVPHFVSCTLASHIYSLSSTFISILLFNPFQPEQPCPIPRSNNFTFQCWHSLGVLRKIGACASACVVHSEKKKGRVSVSVVIRKVPTFEVPKSLARMLTIAPQSMTPTIAPQFVG
jgi:hypothetical protein